MGTKLKKKLIDIYSQKVRIFQKEQNACVLMSMSYELWKVSAFHLKF